MNIFEENYFSYGQKFLKILLETHMIKIIFIRIKLGKNIFKKHTIKKKLNYKETFTK